MALIHAHLPPVTLEVGIQVGVFYAETGVCASNDNTSDAHVAQLRIPVLA